MEPSNKTAPAHVLVVDDDDGVRRVFGRVLVRAGFRITEAQDGTTALALLAKQRFDVILSDIAMPGCSGMQLLAAVREQGYQIQVVLATGNPTLETAMRAGALGAVHYLTKPVEHTLLVDVVRKAVELQRQAPTRSTEPRPGSGSPSKDHAALTATLDRALAQLRLNFQPVVSLTHRCVWGYEALLRSAERSLATPDSVLDAAEQLSQLLPLGRRVRELAAVAVASLPPGGRLLVNIHPIELADPELLDASAPLSRHAARVILEVTERASLHDPSDVERALVTLRALGYGVAVDDLGAGYAGLLSLLHLRPDVVKLDMQLIRDVHQDPRRQKLVRMVLTGCRELAVDVIVEGIETRQERDALAELGCDLMQGYFFGSPAPAFLTVAPDRFL
jgi:EAL domain-containing protein (putative c-di-GMP-specific phosphodiesterase class I)/CheY-like chemotaxis protein